MFWALGLPLVLGSGCALSIRWLRAPPFCWSRRLPWVARLGDVASGVRRWFRQLSWGPLVLCPKRLYHCCGSFGCWCAPVLSSVAPYVWASRRFAMRVVLFRARLLASLEHYVCLFFLSVGPLVAGGWYIIAPAFVGFLIVCSCLQCRMASRTFTLSARSGLAAARMSAWGLRMVQDGGFAKARSCTVVAEVKICWQRPAWGGMPRLGGS